EYPEKDEDDDGGAQGARVVGGDVVHASTVSGRDKTDVRNYLARGKVTVNVAPGPSLLRAVSVPWCSSTIHRAIERPSPAPLFERAGPPGEKGSKIRSRGAGGMPAPSSATVSSTVESCCRRPSSTAPSGPVNFTALSTR